MPGKTLPAGGWPSSEPPAALVAQLPLPTGIRHALVESGVKIVGEAAWMSCRQVQIVHLPDTVVSLVAWRI